ncbi:MAG: PAS domain S-box protein [Blastocatellia bacterium]
MSDNEIAGIHPASQIIVGIEESDSTGWFLLHLHDCLNAVSIRPDQRTVVISQGQGWGRLQNTRIPFENVMRVEAYEVPIGHTCVSGPVDEEAVGEHQSIVKIGVFIPVGIRLLVRGVKYDFLSIYDLGITPLPILVPFLKELPETAFGLRKIKKLRNADDCLDLSKRIFEWAQKVNQAIKKARLLREAEERETSTYAEWASICDQATSNTAHRMQVMYAAYNAIRLWTALATGAVVSASTVKARLRNIKNVRLQHTFPLSSGISQAGSPELQTMFGSLQEEIHRFHDETKRPMQEALDLVSEHIKDLQEMDPGTDALLEEFSLRYSMVEMIKKISESISLFTDRGLSHIEKIEKFFENEKIDICYWKDLDFLSLLVEGETENREKHYIVVIKEGLPQPLTEFLLAHELGHWYIHVKSNLAERIKQVDRYLRSSGKPNFLEEQADQFAMLLLFPPAYLADQEISRMELSAEGLYTNFLEEIKDDKRISSGLKREILKYIKNHIERYYEFKVSAFNVNEFKVSKNPGFSIQVPSIEADYVEKFIDMLSKADNKYWVQTDVDSKIVLSSKCFAGLFGLSVEQIKGKTPKDLIVPEEETLLEWRNKRRKEAKQYIYYFTKLSNEREVIVYSFPILENDNYVGAMAILIPIDEIESSSFQDSIQYEFDSARLPYNTNENTESVS